MLRPTSKWIPFLFIALVMALVVEYLLNWSMNEVIVNSESTYIFDSTVFTILLMIASLLIWFFNKLYFRKSETRSFWNVLYNILSFIVLFYLCFFVKLSVIARVISTTSLNQIFQKWHIRTVDTGAYQTVIIFIGVQVLFLVYLLMKSDSRVSDNSIDFS
jgi:hypothetical protein